MTDKTQLRQELDAAREAKRLRNDLLGDFFNDKKQQLFEYLQDVRIGDTESLVNIHHQIKSLNALQSEIDSVINTGKLASAEIIGTLDTPEN